MMQERFYDVVVVGRSIGALVAAALLARHDFTVLVVGQGQKPCDYEFEEHRLRRRAFLMLAGQSAAWSNVMRELAHTQTWRRQAHPIEPMAQFIFDRGRFDICSEQARFEREVSREFPELRRLIHAHHGDLARVSDAADQAFSRPAMWPPNSFWERRQTGNLAAKLPYARGEQHLDLLSDVPDAHTYRRLVAATVDFSTDLASSPPAFAAARLHGAWTRGLHQVEGGEDEVQRLLRERIEINGGQCRFQESCVSLQTKRTTVSSIQLDGEDGPTGAGFIVTDGTGEELVALSAGQGVRPRATRDWPRVRTPRGRFVVSLIVHRQAIPSPFGTEVFLLDGPDEAPIHVQRTEQGDHILLVAEKLVSDRTELPLRELRMHVLERIARAIPFLEEHLRVVDSVHDGLPIWRYDSDGVRHEVPRSEGVGTSSRPEPMVPQFEVDPPGYLGLAGESVRGPIDNTLLVGSSVLPALGQEGAILAARSAAQVIGRSDRRRARRRGDMWTKIEIT